MSISLILIVESLFLSGESSVLIRFKSVVFPAPDGPVIEIISPFIYIKINFIYNFFVIVSFRYVLN